MASYIAGILVAAAVVLGLYYTVEQKSGSESRMPVSQEDLSKVSPDRLREIALGNSPNRVEAILQLGERPGELEKTLPILTDYLLDRHEMSKLGAESAIGRIGTDAVGHIRELLESGERSNIQIACCAIRAVGDGCDEFLPKLNELMQSDDASMRKCGVFALQGMSRGAAIQSMDGLIKCVKDAEDFNVQCMACRVLEKLGIDALEAEEALLWLLENGNVSARSRAAICLGSIGPTSSNVNIAKLLHAKLEKAIIATEIQRIVVGLAYLGPEASDSLDLIRKISMNHQDASVRASGAFAIWKVGGENAGALEVFKKQIKNSEASIDAIALVGQMGEHGLPLLDHITKLFDSQYPAIRETAVVAVGNFGPKANSARPLIEKMFQDSDPLVRNAARAAFADVTAVEEKKKKE